MSLINREELLKAFGLSEKTRKYGGDHSGYSTWMLYEIQDTIEDVAEVEAIPVDWIEKKMKNLVSPGCKDVLDWLLAEWKEEQNVRKHD